MWEFPQGTFPNGRTGDPTDLARAELEEETGIRARRLRELGYLHCAHSITGQGFHVYLATDLTHGTPHRETKNRTCDKRGYLEANSNIASETATLPTTPPWPRTHCSF